MRKGEVVERLEPKFYLPKYRVNEDKIKNSKFPKYEFRQITKLISDGTHFTPQYKEVGVKFLSVKDVRAFEINYSNSKFISEEEADFLDKRCKPKKGDVLLTKIGTMGLASAINSDERFQLFVSVALLRPNLDFILPNFLALCLNANFIYLQFERVIKGSGVPDLHLEDIRKIKIPVPSLKKQDEITAIFEAAYSEKKQKEAEAAALLAGIDGYLLDALGITLPPPAEKKTFFYTRSGKVSGGRFDPFYHQSEFEELERILNKNLAVKFANLISVITKGETPLWKGESYTESGIPFLKVQNISIDGIIGKLTYIDENLHVQMARSKLHGGELLYTMAGSIGIATILPNDFGEANINQAIAKIVLKNDIAVNHDYLVDTLNSIICKNQAKQFLTVSAQPNINFEQIKQIKIPLPPLEKQTEIAHHIHQIRAQAKRLQQQAAAGLEHAKQQVERMILGEQ